MTPVYIILLGAIITRIITDAKTLNLPVNPIELNDSSTENEKSTEQNSIVDPLSDEFINAINQQNTTWKSEWNFSPNVANDCLKYRVGLLPDTEPHVRVLPQSISKPLDSTLPNAFDSRVKWRNCRTIGEIRNQGCHCNSSWAMAAVDAFADRLCIATDGEFNEHLSTQEILSCCTACVNGNGCNGGSPASVWEFFRRSGVVTGGDYGSEEGCQPYLIAPPPCGNNSQQTERTLACKRECEGGQDLDFKEDHRYTRDALNSTEGEEAMKQIVQYGPIQAFMTVYEDFLSYISGIYQHKTGELVGGHYVRIIGWGVNKTSNTPYWLAANSWGTEWGEKGFFKIERGVNEVGIENGFHYGVPVIN